MIGLGETVTLGYEMIRPMGESAVPPTAGSPVAPAAPNYQQPAQQPSPYAPPAQQPQYGLLKTSTVGRAASATALSEMASPARIAANVVCFIVFPFIAWLDASSLPERVLPRADARITFL